MLIKAVLFDMFDTLMMIEKGHEFYRPSLQRMYNYLTMQGIEVPFERFEAIYIQERDRLYAQADLNWEEPHFNPQSPRLQLRQSRLHCVGGYK